MNHGRHVDEIERSDLWRDKNREWPPEVGWRRLFADQLRRKRLRELPLGQILMYDYDLSRVVRLMNLAGIEEIRLVSTNHDGHHGFIILGRKTAPPSLA